MHLIYFTLPYYYICPSIFKDDVVEFPSVTNGPKNWTFSPQLLHRGSPCSDRRLSPHVYFYFVSLRTADELCIKHWTTFWLLRWVSASPTISLASHKHAFWLCRPTQVSNLIISHAQTHAHADITHWPMGVLSASGLTTPSSECMG